MDTHPPTAPAVPICRTCSHWRVETFILGGQWAEGWRCTVGIRFAGERLDCPSYVREPGSEDW